MTIVTNLDITPIFLAVLNFRVFLICAIISNQQARKLLMFILLTGKGMCCLLITSENIIGVSYNWFILCNYIVFDALYTHLLLCKVEQWGEGEYVSRTGTNFQGKLWDFMLLTWDWGDRQEDRHNGGRRRVKMVALHKTIKPYTKSWNIFVYYNDQSN